ncbi:MAG TPA: fimbria/pilus outer membrane usher protein [Pelomicrobium sp.]|nr:fimbria/pilus outer membrane usher protein [Pelomicrobium sp.]
MLRRADKAHRPARAGHTLVAAALAWMALPLPHPAFAVDPPPARPAAAPLARPIELVLRLTVNGELKGDVVAIRAADGRVLLRRADLAQAGIQPGTAPAVDVGGETYVAADDLTGVRARFDSASLTLALDADPALLDRQVVDLSPRRPAGVIEPDDTSAFFNYLLDYNWSDGEAPGVLGFDNGLGIRAAGVLAFSESRCDRVSGSTHCVRGLSNLTYDSRADLQRYVAGDFLAQSGPLGSTLNLGGLSLSKVFAIDPYLVTQPKASLVGEVAVPSEARILVDGAPVGFQRLRPGPFELRDINYFGGARNVEVVLTDATGREQVLSYPFYFTATLLREGLHEYSYNAGVLREDFRVRSSAYAKAGASFFHRYGVTDGLTVGARGEATETEGNAGPEIAFGLGTLGIASASAAVSYDDRSSETGYAAAAAYDYQRTPFSASALVRTYDQNYAFAGQTPPERTSRDGELTIAFRPVQPRLEVAAAVSYGFLGVGTVGLAYADVQRYEGPDRRSVALTFSGSPVRNLSVFGSVGHTREFESGVEFFIGIAWFPDRDYTATYSQQHRVDGFRSHLAQAGKRVPTGEGFGYNVAYEDSGIGDNRLRTVSPFVQYNGAHGEYLASARLNTGGGGSDLYRVGSAGSIAYVDGTVRAARPIADSFALVRIPGVEGVRVYQNNQEIGRTDAAGTVFVPRLSSYFDNQIRIDDRDIPIEYALETTTLLVSPPLRSGSALTFEARRIQAIVGRLTTRENGITRALDYGELVLKGAPGTFRGPVGRGGEIYLENVPAGDYHLAVDFEGQTCRGRITIPASDEIIVRLGDVACTLE